MNNLTPLTRDEMRNIKAGLKKQRTCWYTCDCTNGGSVMCSGGISPDKCCAASYPGSSADPDCSNQCK